MAPAAPGPHGGTSASPTLPGLDPRRRSALPVLWLLLLLTPWCSAPVGCIQVTVSKPFQVVILFQPVTLPCSYQVSGVPTPPIVLWKYKSFCRDRIADAFSSASSDSQLNAQLAASNSGYNPYVECQDSSRTVRVVATKQGNAVTLGEFYQGRRITITGDADLTFDQTAWGDSGVYYCSVVSAQDLQGNNEAYAELIVLDWLFVVVVVLAAFLVFLLLGICWCQCCPHTCCCYVRCPCCPDKCCCPEALYAAGKAATSGVPSIYAPSVYAPSTYAHLAPVKASSPPPMITMGPVHNGFTGDFDRQSSVGGHSSQVPLLRDTDSTRNSEVRSGYRIQANQQDDSMKVLYYMEKELANFDPSRPGLPNGRVERAMSEVTSLHEDDWRSRPHRGPALTPIQDEDLDYRSQRSPGGWERERERDRERERPRDREGRWEAGRPRAHSVDALDDLGRPSSVESGRTSPSERSRGRPYAPPRSRSRDDLYSRSGDPYYDDFRSRGRPLDDARRDPHGSYSRSRDPEYDGRLLEDVLRKKEVGERRRPHREEEEPYYPPAPPPYTETESQSSRERRLKKNLGLSRESLVV
ncbi:lipolysis-stimulated lipoprotein receptor isoform X2 [Trichosurus vulpecula]|uniref:lipolysis-stimulated lipoprotein receptor isoform X2 n=1 Tax=Trichosurus vulpecula TaxID=9337 RepID=UPI00186AF5F0|nr:lipolysis-stimulated lipoprotein receptor isoform X2 [Trichosurus vulpecula]